MNMDTFNTALKSQMPIQESMLEQFEKYADYLYEQNQLLNLTAITERSEVYEKHFYDSILVQSMIPANSKIADIGSGAGFPGICLAIVRPDCQFTLIEALNKRCRFLESIIQLLNLKNVTILNHRAEECRDMLEAFDCVTARAVANLAILMEICIPLLKVNGIMIAMKGQKAQIEIDEAKHAFIHLNASLDKIQSLELPTAGYRNNILIRKNKANDLKYPRPYGQIKKKPL
ncbi:MAG: 16S rRNA (guanine(527)-N(7))-methyltransferase RsmG [Erysipelotrichaceae bacterium]